MTAFVVPCDLFFWNFAIAQMSRLFFIYLQRTLQTQERHGSQIHLVPFAYLSRIKHTEAQIFGQTTEVARQQILKKKKLKKIKSHAFFSDTQSLVTENIHQ